MRGTQDEHKASSEPQRTSKLTCACKTPDYWRNTVSRVTVVTIPMPTDTCGDATKQTT